MSQASNAGAGQNGRSEQPDGMEHEAAILSALAKVSSPTAAWIGPPTEQGNSITVPTPLKSRRCVS